MFSSTVMLWLEVVGVWAMAGGEGGRGEDTARADVENRQAG